MVNYWIKTKYIDTFSSMIVVYINKSAKFYNAEFYDKRSIIWRQLK